MSIEEFIVKYREAFGESVPLPIAFGYSDKAVEEARKIPRCMIGAIRKVCDGKPLTLSAENVLCGGGSLYTAFAPMPERVPVFVSEVEHYKQTPGQVREYVDRLDIQLTEKPYLNFTRLDPSPRPTYCPVSARGRSTTTMPMMPFAPSSARAVVVS